MTANSEDERDYLIARGAEHRCRAESAATDDLRRTHERFAAAYTRRAAEILVQSA